ncbi:MAG: hypothetical protein D3916_14435 [Candidatus Electrothrix sp. MAN1_4]|nr:hypothetical protein [Candidatus Electrothrix sp. MAN1_4]
MSSNKSNSKNLPEEERFAGVEKAKAGRLFPADEDRRIIHLVEQGTSLRKDGDQIVAYLTDGTKAPANPSPMPQGVEHVSALVLHGNVQICELIFDAERR